MPSPASPTAIDHRGFPHIIDRVIRYAGYAALSRLAQTSKAYRARLDAELSHVVITPRARTGVTSGPLEHFSIVCHRHLHANAIVADDTPESAALAREYLSRATIIDVAGTLHAEAAAALVKLTPQAHTLRVLAGEWTHRPANWGVHTFISLGPFNITDAYAPVKKVVVRIQLHHRYMPTQLYDLLESDQAVQFIFPTRDTFGNDLGKPVPESAHPRNVAFTRSSIYMVLAYARLSLFRGQALSLVGMTEYHPEWYNMDPLTFTVPRLQRRLADYAYVILCGPGGSGDGDDPKRERAIANAIEFPTHAEYRLSLLDPDLHYGDPANDLVERKMELVDV